jgi:hypothetical protein
METPKIDTPWRTACLSHNLHARWHLKNQQQSFATPAAIAGLSLRKSVRSAKVEQALMNSILSHPFGPPQAVRHDTHAAQEVAKWPNPTSTRGPVVQAKEQQFSIPKSQRNINTINDINHKHLP